MKTAISIPDNLFKIAEITAKRLGLARSQLYVKAIKEFIERHNKENITEKLNSIYPIQSDHENITDIGIDSISEASENDPW